MLGFAMSAAGQTTQRQFQLQKTGDAPPQLKLVDAPVRQPGEYEVLVRVHAVSLNRRDVYVKMGRYPGPMRPNLVPLSDGAGEVVAIGPRTTRFKKGDRVAAIFFQQWIEGRFKQEHFASALGGAVDGYVDPVQFYARQESDYRPSILDLINLRVQFFQTEQYIEEAYDPYAFVRDAYRQRRIYAIYDGEPPQELINELGHDRVATLLTQVLVDPGDPAFVAPTKPIGPVYGRETAERLARERGWTIAADGPKSRRVVPASPRRRRRP
jgi:hypothetical protein